MIAKSTNYRIQIYNFSSTFYNGSPFSGLDKILNFWNKNWRIRIFKGFDAQNQALIESFKAGINKNIESKNSDF